MKPIVVARRYARALADVAGRDDAAKLEALSSELTLLSEVLARVPEMARYLGDPSIDPADKRKAATALEKGTRLSDTGRRFLEVLIDRRRLAALPAIAQAFADIRDAAQGVVPAETTTAVALSSSEQKKLKEALQALTGRRVRLTLRVDPSVLGGAKTQIGSRVYDGTVRRRLQMLRARLAVAR